MSLQGNSGKNMDIQCAGDLGLNDSKSSQEFPLLKSEDYTPTMVK